MPPAPSRPTISYGPSLRPAANDIDVHESLHKRERVFTENVESPHRRCVRSGAAAYAAGWKKFESLWEW
jgi:hypothetical protein